MRTDVGPAEQKRVVRVEHQFDAMNDPAVQDEAGDERAAGRLVQVPDRPRLQLDVVGLGDAGVRLVERPVGPRAARTGERRHRQDDREQNRLARRHDCDCDYTLALRAGPVLFIDAEGNPPLPSECAWYVPRWSPRCWFWARR